MHHSIVPADQITNITTPVVPLWAVVQAPSALNEQETAMTHWTDWVFPVHAIGNIPNIEFKTSARPSGAFLVVDPSAATVAWLRYSNGHMPKKTGFDNLARVFFTDEKPERGQHPCPRFWCIDLESGKETKPEFEPTTFECDLFC